MKVLGIAVRVNKLKSTVSLVLMEGVPGGGVSSAKVVEHLPVVGDDSDWAAHVGNVAAAVRGHANSMAPDAIVIRRADQAPRGRNSDGPKIRLMVEGGIVAAVLDVVPDVRVFNGRECGKSCGLSKEQLDSAAETLVGKAQAEAAAAALAGLA